MWHSLPELLLSATVDKSFNKCQVVHTCRRILQCFFWPSFLFMLVVFPIPCFISCLTTFQFTFSIFLFFRFFFHFSCTTLSINGTPSFARVIPLSFLRSLFSSSPPIAVSVFLISAPSVSLPIVHLVINRLHIIFFLKLPFIPTFIFSSSSRQLSVPFTHAFRLTQLLSHTCIFSCCVSVSSVVSRPSIHAGVTHEQNTFPFRMLTRYAPVLKLRICRCSHPPVFTQMYTTVSLL